MLVCEQQNRKGTKMTVKTFKSTLTWRRLDYQDQVFAGVVPGWPNVPVYIGEDDLLNLIRPTRRTGITDLYVASLAVLAREEDDFKIRMTALLKNKTHIFAIEDNMDWSIKSKISDAVKAWKAARIEDAGHRGGVISATKRKLICEAGAKIIKDRWKLPSNEWPTKVLLKEAGISLNTAKSNLGRRPIEQANYQAMLKRKEKRATEPRYKRATDYIDEAS